jgi:hypothetical protein
VNFMNNPDEATAVEQFGDGDKYFGVATMLATLPGLPMLGHGQIEGFREKYGMEFRRAALDEEPSDWLIARHEREIFPLLRQRWRFADAHDFRLHPFDSGAGDDQNVFAYSNGWGDTRSLVVYHNRYGDTRGFVSGVGERLGVTDDGNRWVILRDHRSGLEFLRNAHDLHARGLELSLNAYQAHVFLAFEEVVDTPEREWSRLAWRIGLAGVPDLHAELTDQRMAPLVDASARFIEADAIRRLAGAALTRDDTRAADHRSVLLADLTGRLGELALALGVTADVAQLTRAAGHLQHNLDSLVDAARDGRRGGRYSDLARYLGTSRSGWTTIGSWALADAALDLDEDAERDRGRAFDAWGLGRATAAAGRDVGLGDPEAGRSEAIVRALLTLEPLDRENSGSTGREPQDPAADGSEPVPVRDRASTSSTTGGQVGLLPSSLTGNAAFRTASGWNEFEGVKYVSKEPFEELLDALAARDSLAGSTEAFGIAQGLKATVEAAGYRVGGRAGVRNT